MTNPDYRALCVELTDCLEKADWPHRYKVVFQQWTDIAHAALAEPDGPAVPEGREPASVATQPSDTELLEPGWRMTAAVPTKDEAVALYSEVMAVHNCQTLGDMAEHFARAVLARWAHPAAAPVPVSERLPAAGEWVWHCYAEVRFWEHGRYNGRQFFIGDGPESQPATHWLPANALPLPAPEGGEVS